MTDSKQYPTGPAMEETEATEIYNLSCDPRWQVFAAYLKRTRDMAFKRHMRLDTGREASGYYKGLYNLAQDLIDLPEKLGLQIDVNTKKE
jgi:hypothetical protein